MDSPTKFIPTRSKSTNTLPERPLSSYSMSSTIRRVTPSDEDSFTEELKENAAAHSTPKQRRRNSSAELVINRPDAPTPVAGVRGRQTEALQRRDNYAPQSPLPRRVQMQSSSPNRQDSRPFKMHTPHSYDLFDQSMRRMAILEPRPGTPTPMPRSHRRSRYQYIQPYDEFLDSTSLTNGFEGLDGIEAMGKVDSDPRPVSPVRNLFGAEGTEFYKKTEWENGSPFERAKTVEELQEERRKVSGDAETTNKEKRCCIGVCSVM